MQKAEGLCIAVDDGAQWRKRRYIEFVEADIDEVQYKQVYEQPGVNWKSGQINKGDSAFALEHLDQD
ncbi:hypothetical protein ACFSJQ_17895 [Vibrio olivae]|uniref:Uncharacterized protein n=1 Tax=Vibrio olivae TaxID=1243002 RepID=A0ABV5HPG7_9VIBR